MQTFRFRFEPVVVKMLPSGSVHVPLQWSGIGYWPYISLLDRRLLLQCWHWAVLTVSTHQ
jgi:hypothetical protein